MKKSKLTKAMLVLSVYVLLLWGALGAGATVAWFSDTTPVARNTFEIALLDLKVGFRNDAMTDYAGMTDQTPIFNDQAIYEPGYTQVVYLKIQNPGDVEFQYKVAVNVVDYGYNINKYGATFTLPPHLRYGVVFGDSEAELNRQLAQAFADQNMGELAQRLNTYSKYDTVTVPAAKPGDTDLPTRYAALVVYMPEETGNEANYEKPAERPYVELGVTVYAQQAGTPKPEDTI